MLFFFILILALIIQIDKHGKRSWDRLKHFIHFIQFSSYEILNI